MSPELEQQMCSRTPLIAIERGWVRSSSGCAPPGHLLGTRPDEGVVDKGLVGRARACEGDAVVSTCMQDEGVVDKGLVGRARACKGGRA